MVKNIRRRKAALKYQPDQLMTLRQIGQITGKKPVYFRKLVEYKRLQAHRPDGHFWQVTVRSYCDYIRSCRQYTDLLKSLRGEFVDRYIKLIVK
jgi:hypothetical protein